MCFYAWEKRCASGAAFLGAVVVLLVGHFLDGGEEGLHVLDTLFGGGRCAGGVAQVIVVADVDEHLADGVQAFAFDDFACGVLHPVVEFLQVAELALVQVQAQAQRPLVVSIAAGITAVQLERWLGGGIAVVRSMPNTPALLGAGATGLYANASVDAGQRERADSLMRAAGLTAWIPDEALMDAVTAVSGSGPAYVFLLAEAMQAAGEAQGLAPDTARTLVLQTILGAARMLSESGEPAATLRQHARQQQASLGH